MFKHLRKAQVEDGSKTECYDDDMNGGAEKIKIPAKARQKNAFSEKYQISIS